MYERKVADRAHAHAQANFITPTRHHRHIWQYSQGRVGNVCSTFSSHRFYWFLINQLCSSTPVGGGAVVNFNHPNKLTVTVSTWWRLCIYVLWYITYDKHTRAQHAHDIYIYAPWWVWSHIHMYLHLHLHLHTHAYAYLFIYIYIYIYIYIHVCKIHFHIKKMQFPYNMCQ